MVKKSWPLTEGYCQFKAKFRTLIIEETLCHEFFTLWQKFNKKVFFVQIKCCLTGLKLSIEFCSNFQWKIARTNNKICQIPFALLLHKTVFGLFWSPWNWRHSSDYQGNKPEQLRKNSTTLHQPTLTPYLW